MDEQGNCLNWYTQPKVRKIMGPVDEQAEDLARRRTGLGLHTRWLYIGQSGSGKRQMVLSHLALTSEGTKCAYDRVVICTAMTEEPLYAFLKETLKDKCKLYSPSDLPDVDQLVSGTPKKGDNVFLVLDDLIADLERNRELLRRVTRYAIFGRKKHVTMVFLSQNFYAVPVTVRRQMNRLMICGMTSKSRMEGAPSALGITLDECPISRNFAYNFTGWLNPADFGPVKRGEGLTTPRSDGRPQAPSPTCCADFPALHVTPPFSQLPFHAIYCPLLQTAYFHPDSAPQVVHSATHVPLWNRICATSPAAASRCASKTSSRSFASPWPKCPKPQPHRA